MIKCCSTSITPRNQYKDHDMNISSAFQQTKFEEVESLWMQLKQKLNIKREYHHKRYNSNIQNKITLKETEDDLNINDLDTGDCRANKPKNQSILFVNPFIISKNSPCKTNKIIEHPENVVSESIDADSKDHIIPSRGLADKPGKPQETQKSAAHSSIKIPMNISPLIKLSPPKKPACKFIHQRTCSAIMYSSYIIISFI